MDEKIKSKVGEKLVVRIDSLAFGGDGVGRVDGEVIFVPYAAPGDTLRVRVTEAKAHYRKGVIDEVLEPGACRRAPRCRHFGRCGGCFWQHVDYSTQAEAKQRIIEESLRRIGGIETNILPIVPSPSEYGYRNRVRLHVSAKGEIGYFERGSNRLVAIEECPVLQPELLAGLPALVSAASAADTSRFAAPGAARPFRTVELSADAAPANALQSWSDEEREALPPFRQVNPEVNRKMLQFIRTSVAERTRSGTFRVLDLFCGDGNLSLPLAEQATSFEGLDLSREAVAHANAEAERIGLAGRYRVADVRRAARGGFRQLAVADGPDHNALVVLADPPRAGLGEVAEAVAATSATILVYVSCNPPVLARDSRRLVSAGFVLDMVQPFDMFPQTYHVEAVALFTREAAPIPRQDIQLSPLIAR